MHERRIIPLPEAEKLGETLRGENRSMVFTNGCFDILHVGHVRYLESAKRLGDALIVGINSDASVRALKGENRPVNTEADRAEVLAALRCVDYVVIFPQVRATELICAVRPQLYAKGGDYTPESLHPEELTVLRKIGTEIHILPLVPGKSTTGLLHRIEASKA